MTRDDRDFLDYAYVLVRWRRLLLVGTLAAAAAAAGISLILPERWTAQTTLLPPEEDGGGFGLSLLAGGSSVPPGLASLVGMATPSERLLTLLDSRHLLGLAVDRFDLVRTYDALHRDQAIDILAENVERKLGSDGSLEIEATASTPQLAADLTNALAGLLDSLNREYKQGQARATRGFLEERVARTRADLEADAGRMRDFQKEHGLVDIENQTAAAVEVVKGIVLELSLQQVELGVVSRQLAPDHPDRQLLAVRVDELDRRLRALVGDLASGASRESERLRSGSGPLGPPLKALPDVMHDYAEFALQLKMREEILTYLGAKLEESKYREALDTPTLQVLDVATPPKTRSAPRRAVLTAVAGGSAAVLLAMLAFAFEGWRRSQESRSEQIEAIRSAWRR